MGRLNRHRENVFARSGGFCIYCGGGVRATTIDHMPPISMFWRRDRPSGLEFPSCEPCNQGARTADLVAALIGRVLPDTTDESEEAELRRILAAVERDVPGLLSEMRANRASEKLLMGRLGLTQGGALRLSGPLATSHLEAFAARLGFAMHFQATGRIVPPEGGVAVRVYSNVELVEGDIPPEIFEHLPSPETLRQGKKTVEEQFKYALLSTDTRTMSMSFASFRLGFAVLAISSEDTARVEGEGVHIIRPGRFFALPRHNYGLALAARGSWTPRQRSYAVNLRSL